MIVKVWLLNKAENMQNPMSIKKKKTSGPFSAKKHDVFLSKSNGLTIIADVKPRYTNSKYKIQVNASSSSAYNPGRYSNVTSKPKPLTAFHTSTNEVKGKMSSSNTPLAAQGNTKSVVDSTKLR